MSRVGPALREEVAESEKMPGLLRVRLAEHHGFESGDSFEEFILPIIGESDVQPDSGDLRHQMLSVPQGLQSLSPLFAPHVHHS